MTVGELREMLVDLPNEMLVGCYDQDDQLCEVQIAGVCSTFMGYQIFQIRANGGFPLPMLRVKS